MLLLDTHIFLYLFQDELTEAERNQIRAADQLALSSISLWEIAKLYNKKRITLALSDPTVQELLSFMKIFQINSEIASISAKLDIQVDPADEIILATSIVEKVPLMTHDRKIMKSRHYKAP